MPLIVVASMWSSRGHASRPSCPPHLAGPPSERGARLWRVEPRGAMFREAARVDCTEARCTLERELAITSTSDRAYDGLVLAPLQVWIDGVPGKESRLSDLVSDARFGAALGELCRGIDQATCLQGGLDREASPAAPPFAYATVVHVEPGKTVRVTVRGELRFAFEPSPLDVRLGCPGSVDPPPILDRHPLLAAWRERGPRVGTAVVPFDDTAEITVSFPSSWKITMPGQGPTSRATDGTGRSVLRASARGPITITRVLPPASWLRMGGPFLAAGAAMANDASSFTLRAGYELAHGPSWLIYSAALETDFERLRVIPVVEAALPTSWHVHWAAGVGFPVELVDPRVGVRLQIALHLTAVGIVGTWDEFPGRDERVYGVYGQLSL